MFIGPKGVEGSGVDEFRAAERARMAPMREAARKEAFVQGWIWSRFGAPPDAGDEALLNALKSADEAYLKFIKQRGPV